MFHFMRGAIIVSFSFFVCFLKQIHFYISLRQNIPTYIYYYYIDSNLFFTTPLAVYIIY